MNLFFKLWMIPGIVLIGLMSLEMDMKNLIKISSLTKYNKVLPKVENGFDNIRINKHIRLQQGDKINLTMSKSTINYSKASLINIADKVRSYPRYKVINSITCKNIRKLKLNRKGYRGGVRMKSHLDIIHPNSSNIDNLIKIRTEHQELTPNHCSLCICLANIQSIKKQTIDITSVFGGEQYRSVCSN